MSLPAPQAVDVADPMDEPALRARCEAMEQDRRLADAPSAERVAMRARELDCTELAMRATLAWADALGRAGSPQPAAALLDEVERWAVAATDDFVLARCHFIRSIACDMQGDRAGAAHHACLSVDGLPEHVPLLVRARHLVTLALSLDQVRLGDGLPYYQEALDIAAALGHPGLSVSVLNNLVWNELDVEDMDSAWVLAQRMRQIAEGSGIELRAADLETIALVELGRGDPAAAEGTLQPIVADPPRAMLTEVTSLPRALRVLATAQRLQGLLAEAQHSLDRAGPLCEAAGLGSTAVLVSEEQAQVYAAAGRFQDAYEEHRRFHARSQDLLSAERDAQARATQLAFESREGQRQSERYREMAMRDALTGLYNRRFLDSQLPGLIAVSLPHGPPVSLAIIDIDFFKRVNDTLSHDVGDAVLQQIARLLTEDLHEPATVARLGGEEFVLVLPGTDPRAALAAAERLRATVQAHDWAPLTGRLPITVSVGVASSGRHTADQSALLHCADRNLYAAKHAGRNRVVAG